MLTSNAPIDTKLVIETPEGVDLELQIAGPLVRAVALLMDYSVKCVILAAISILWVYFGRVGQGLFWIFAFLLEWFYPVFFELLRQGQTPGKYLFGLRVVHADGTPISWEASVLRNLLRVADFLPVGYIFGLITMISTKHLQRVGDVVAGTLVVFQNSHNRKEADLHPQQREPQADMIPLAPPISLTTEEQLAILQFVERSSSLSRARANELANHLTGLTHGRDEVAVQNLLHIGEWLKGGRA